MSETRSQMLALGTTAPGFSLPDTVSARQITSASYRGEKALLVMFICAHCPYVIHILPALARLGRDYAAKDLGIIAISSNDADAYPDDAPEKLKEMALSADLSFPVCYDGSQEVAKAYGAACTPDFFLFNGERLLVYRGQFDSSRPGKGRPDGRDLRAAVDAVIQGVPVSPDQKPSVGCGIKWKRSLSRT